MLPRSDEEIIEFSKRVPGYYDEDELRQLLELTKKLPKKSIIVEIGVEFGRSASIFLQRPQNWSQLHLVDDRSHSAVMGRVSTGRLLWCFQNQDSFDNAWRQYLPPEVYSTRFDRPNHLGVLSMPQNMVYDREVTSSFAAEEWGRTSLFPIKKIDLLHIDGDHEDGIWEDCRLWLPFVAEGGIVVFHDYKRKGADPYSGSVFPKVDNAVESFLLNSSNWEFLEFINTQVSFRKIG